jgi:hypothetical protein
VRLVSENVNLGNLTNHPKIPRSILATLVSGHGAHNDFFSKEVKRTKWLPVRSHPYKDIFGNVRDVVVVAYLRSETVLEELVQHPIDGLHTVSSAKLNLVISDVIHECHLTVKWDLSTMNLWTTKIIFTKAKNLSEPLIRDRERLSLQEPMECLGFTSDIEISVELSHHLLIPITIHSHNGGHALGVTNIDGFIYGLNVE